MHKTTRLPWIATSLCLGLLLAGCGPQQQKNAAQNTDSPPIAATNTAGSTGDSISNNDEIIVTTHVSKYVPKDSFIPDGMSAFARNVKRIGASSFFNWARALSALARY